MMTARQYEESLRKLKLEVYMFGKRIGGVKMKAAFTLRGAIQDQGIRHIYGRFDATSEVVVGS